MMMNFESDTITQSLIHSQVEITGTVKTEGSLRIDGKLKGDLECGGDAVIGKSARIEGNLVVNSVSVAGQVNGNITARDRIEMKSSAKVTGDIKAKRLAVEDGVTFIGRSEVTPTGPTAETQANTRAPKTESEPPSRDAKGGIFTKK
ncbi:MAG: polymer-forming cytoskeletal protein [Verrucomicrobia bacterium]|nr:MAG: polymer-forming cytoskeletal protein [Verrucomicrobiota bacterium]